MHWHTILILLVGVVATGWFYIPPGVAYYRRGDDYGASITVVAASATLIIVMGFGAISHMTRMEIASLERSQAADAAFEKQMDDLAHELEHAKAAQQPGF